MVCSIPNVQYMAVVLCSLYGGDTDHLVLCSAHRKELRDQVHKAEGLSDKPRTHR